MRAVGVGFGILMVSVFAWKGFQAGSAMSAQTPAFNFKTASAQERQVWLEEQTALMSAQLERQLPPGNHMGPRMELTGTRIGASSRAIHFDIQIKGPAQLVDDMTEVKQAAQKKACPEYMGSAIGKNDIYVYQNFRFSDGSRAMSVGLTPSLCKRLLES